MNQHLPQKPDADYIDGLIRNRVRECRTIEYKQELPDTERDMKNEFLFDVASFVNANGGVLVYGVVEERDRKGKPTGIPSKAEGIPGVNIDSELLRMEEMVRGGIDPIVQGLRIFTIEGYPSGPVIVVTVPESSAAPHWVSPKGVARYFVIRNDTSAGKHHMTYEEVKEAFINSLLRSRVSLSPDAQRVAEHLVRNSKNALPNDPMTNVKELSQALSISPEDVLVAVDELLSLGWVFVDGPPNDPTRIWAESALYWALDEDVKGDALKLAQEVVSDGANLVTLANLAERLGWDTRRTNPAATYLVELDIVKPGRGRNDDFAFPYLLKTPSTLRFVREQS